MQLRFFKGEHCYTMPLNQYMYENARLKHNIYFSYDSYQILYNVRKHGRPHCLLDTFIKIIICEVTTE